jgi:hypothetical protein
MDKIEQMGASFTKGAIISLAFNTSNRVTLSVSVWMQMAIQFYQDNDNINHERN